MNWYWTTALCVGVVSQASAWAYWRLQDDRPHHEIPLAGSLAIDLMVTTVTAVFWPVTVPMMFIGYARLLGK